jgi:hypothetical protein
VRDGAGRPVQGATVMLLERGASARTDADGRYCLEAKAGSDSLIVSVIGFRSKRVPVEIESSGSLAAVTLDAVSALPSDALALRGGRADDARFRADGVAPGALAPAPAPAVAFPDSLKPLVARATQTFAEGKRRADASKLDAAAAEWERVLRAARPGAAELAARERIADARFAAWEAAPTSRRAAAAIEALTAFLTRAPQGPARTLAVRRLDRIRPAR